MALDYKVILSFSPTEHYLRTVYSIKCFLSNLLKSFILVHYCGDHLECPASQLFDGPCGVDAIFKESIRPLI